MNPSNDRRPVLSYAEPPARRPFLRISLRDVSLNACIVAALWFGLLTFAEVEHYAQSPSRAYADYLEDRAWHRTTQPAYAPAPFVGEKFNRVSVWELWTTYASAGAVIVVAAVVLNAKRRRHGLG